MVTAAIKTNRVQERAEQVENLKGAVTVSERRLLDNWLTLQGINLTRHANSLRPFTKEEFGTGPAAPSEAHIKAVNRFIDSLRVQLDEMARWVEAETLHLKQLGMSFQAIADHIVAVARQQRKATVPIPQEAGLVP